MGGIYEKGMVKQLRTILFDLDGTLLPMVQEHFLKEYMGRLVKELAKHGYESKQLMQTIMMGIEAMVKNDGSCTNEAAFWDTFCRVYGKEAILDLPKFEAFYQEIFPSVKNVCGYTPMANEVIKDVKDRGYRVVLATNPMFPAIATKERMRWAGLDIDDFELVTTYENCSTSKPNPAYYRDIAHRLGVTCEDCLMVGNDVDEDILPAKSVGMQTFLLTDCLINKGNHDISQFPHGKFVDLLSFVL